MDIYGLISGLKWWQSLLIGAGIGLLITPAIVLFMKAYRLIVLRRRIKKMLKTGQFLKPIDPNDVDVSKWGNIINFNNYKEEVEGLRKRTIKINNG